MHLARGVFLLLVTGLYLLIEAEFLQLICYSDFILVAAGLWDRIELCALTRATDEIIGVLRAF